MLNEDSSVCSGRKANFLHTVPMQVRDQCWGWKNQWGNKAKKLEYVLTTLVFYTAATYLKINTCILEKIVLL